MEKLNNLENFGDVIADLNEEQKKAFAVYVNAFNITPDDDAILENFFESFEGEWLSERNFAINLVDELDFFRGVPEAIEMYFDYEAFTNDLFIDEYYFDSGFVFRCV